MRKFILLLVIGFHSCLPVAAATMGIVISNQSNVWVNVTLDVVEHDNRYIFVEVPPQSSRWFESFDLTPKNVSAWSYNSLDNKRGERVIAIDQPIGNVETAIIEITFNTVSGYKLRMYSDVWNDFLNNIISHSAFHTYFVLKVLDTNWFKPV